MKSIIETFITVINLEKWIKLFYFGEFYLLLLKISIWLNAIPQDGIFLN